MNQRTNAQVNGQMPRTAQVPATPFEDLNFDAVDMDGVKATRKALLERFPDVLNEETIPPPPGSDFDKVAERVRFHKAEALRHEIAAGNESNRLCAIIGSNRAVKGERSIARWGKAQDRPDLSAVIDALAPPEKKLAKLMAEHRTTPFRALDVDAL